jgi:mono/diheme cytochrome c family protein
MNSLMASGAKLYEKHCVECHDVDGEGVPLVYPKLKGNAAVMSHPGNALRIVLAGGFARSTSANPRPYGMPPFAPLLSDAEIALVSTYTRNAWGNRGLSVLSSNVNPYRTAPQD